MFYVLRLVYAGQEAPVFQTRFPFYAKTGFCRASFTVFFAMNFGHFAKQMFEKVTFYICFTMVFEHFYFCTFTWSHVVFRMLSSGIGC